MIIYGIKGMAAYAAHAIALGEQDPWVSKFIYQVSDTQNEGGQWLRGRVLDSRLRGSRFKPHRRHCIVVLEQDTLILA